MAAATYGALVIATATGGLKDTVKGGGGGGGERWTCVVGQLVGGPAKMRGVSEFPEIDAKNPTRQSLVFFFWGGGGTMFFSRIIWSKHGNTRVFAKVSLKVCCTTIVGDMIYIYINIYIYTIIYTFIETIYRYRQ